MSAADVALNSHAMRHRARRAALLAAKIRELGMDATDAQGHSSAWWEEVAGRAGISLPSPTTRAMTLGLLDMPELGGLPVPVPKSKPARCDLGCGICGTRLTGVDPVESHLGALVHAICQHNYDKGWGSE